MKKSRKILKAILVIIILLIAVNLSFRLYYHFQFNRRVKELSEQGFPVSLDDLEKAYVLPEGVENAADVYLEAFSYYQEPNEFEREYLPIRGNYCWGDNVPPFPEEVMKVIESSLLANQKTLALLDEAGQMEHCLWPRKIEKLEDIYFPQEYLKGIKVSGMMICERNLYLAQRHQAHKVFESFQTAFALSESSMDHPFLVDYLVSIALKAMTAANLREVMNQVEFTEDELRSLQKRFSEMQDHNGYREMLINDRCVSIVGYDLLFNEYFSGNSFSQCLSNSFYFLSAAVQKDKLLSLDSYDLLLQASQLPPEQLPSMITKIRQEFDSYSDFHLYVHNLYGLARVSEISLRVLGNLRCDETVLAIERYRLKYNTLPQSLEELVPEFMETVPLEPFDGEPLRYIRHDVGYTVYTIGDDGVDNGGLSRKQMEEKTGEENPEEYDWPFTVRR